MTETRDPFGNRIFYDYEPDHAADRNHNGQQLYLKRIRYVDLDDSDDPDCFVSVEFLYNQDAPRIVPEFPRQPRPDFFSDYRAGFEIRTTKRCNGIVVRTHPTADTEVLVRAYEFIYLDEQFPNSTTLPLNQVSLLSRINIIGYDDEGQPVRELPPLDFSYSQFTPETRKFIALNGAALPVTSLANPDMELLDLFGHGLPDILELGNSPRYWRNLGNGSFDRARSIPEVPAELRLSESGVQLIDANGDGRADLLVTTEALSGYYPLDFRAGFSKKSFQPYQQAPSFNLEDPEVRLVDLTGDGVTDVLRSGTSFECYFNDPKQGWLPKNTSRVPRKGLAAFPNVNFADPRVKFTDMSGDGLQDIAVVYQGRIDYWPNLGHGQWAPRITTQITGGLPFDFDPKRVLLSDVDGDGLADLVYVSNREVTLWINRTGNGWSKPIVIQGTPSLTDTDTVRIIDLLGNGVGGILWTRDSDGSGRPSHFFLDFTGGIKPYLLNRMDNNLGAITEVSYSSSTKFYLRDQARQGTPWRSTLPFPVHVVERVKVTDLLSSGSLTTEYRYHHGYWDGTEREFRGFGMVEQLDTEVFDGYLGRGIDTDKSTLQQLLAKQTYSPPMLTRTWFHQGPVMPDKDGHWNLMDYSKEYWQQDPDLLNNIPLANPDVLKLRDAQRSLRGSILRSEVYALDGSALEDRPYTVTEQFYDVREELKLSANSTPQGIYFPHSIAQRTTQWERGDDPLTQITFTHGYDDVGQPARQISIACPRGWRNFTDRPGSDYLATFTHTLYTQGTPTGPYLRDRVSRTRSFELLQTHGKALEALLTTLENSENLRLFAESLNYYDGKKDDPDFRAFTGLDFGQLGDFGALVRTEVLVMTQEQLTNAYGSAIPPYLTPGGIFQASSDYPSTFVTALPKLAGYQYKPVSADNTAGYFSVAVSKQYDFHNNSGIGRGLLLAQRDPLGHEARIEYDDYNLLPTKVIDAAGFETHARYNLRTLQPEQITDPNGNVTRIKYSPTGLVTETWALGKPDAANDDRANAGDRQVPSARIEYHLRAFHESRLADPDNPQPVYARAIRRVFHDSDPNDTGETIEGHEYSDGFGRLLQTRTQGESVRFGDPDFGGGNDVLPADQNAPSTTVIVGTENADTDHPNVIISGWQRYDNKGQIVEKLEPFYAAGWQYQPVSDAQMGKSVTMYYDPRGQVVRTVNPDGSEQRVIHGIPMNLDDPPLSPLDSAKFTPTPWEAYTYDANDNAGRTHAGVEPHTRYFHHFNTPASIEVDALGRTIRAVARHRGTSQTGNPTAIEEHITRSTYDIQGNLTGIRDALGRLAFEYVYDLIKRPLRTESIDAGRKTAVLDAAGNPVENRDAKGALGLHAYDELNRPTHVWARDNGGESMTLREQLFYDRDPATPDAAANANLLGQLWRHRDEAGEVKVGAYDLKGQVMRSSRRVLSDDFMLSNFMAHVQGDPWNLQAPRVDWANPPPNLLDARGYETRSAYDALGRIQWSDYPEAANGERYRLKPDYNRAGALESVALIGPLDANDQGAAQVYVQRIAYNAKGQRTLIAYGNGILTRYVYDPATFRLARLRTERYVTDTANPLSYLPQEAPLQDIAYSYDLAGNILLTEDRTPGCGVSGTAEGENILIRRFGYDPLYRLISASGREAALIPAPRPWHELAVARRNNDVVSGCYMPADPPNTTQSNAPNLTSLYEERYEYDPAGNMLRLSHRRQDLSQGWSRYFGMAGFNPKQWKDKITEFLAGNLPDWGNEGNRLTNCGNDDEQVPTHTFDENGNMVGENTARYFEWDHADRMKAFCTQIDGNSAPSIYALYLYDSGGQRVKKLVVKGNRYNTTTYLGAAFEHHTEQNLNGGGKQENCSLHVMDDQSRIAVVRVGPAYEDDGAKEHPVQYQLGDHLGSSVLVISGTGAWMNREEYFPYGETSFGRKRYRFTGKERDEESGIEYHGARYYAQGGMRWISADPLGSQDGLNLYAYVGTNPLAYSDSSGLAKEQGDAGSSAPPTICYDPEISYDPDTGRPIIHVHPNSANVVHMAKPPATNTPEQGNAAGKSDAKPESAPETAPHSTPSASPEVGQSGSMVTASGVFLDSMSKFASKTSIIWAGNVADSRRVYDCGETALQGAEWLKRTRGFEHLESTVLGRMSYAISNAAIRIWGNAARPLLYNTVWKAVSAAYGFRAGLSGNALLRLVQANIVRMPRYGVGSLFRLEARAYQIGRTVRGLGRGIGRRLPIIGGLLSAAGLAQDIESGDITSGVGNALGVATSGAAIVGATAAAHVLAAGSLGYAAGSMINDYFAQPLIDKAAPGSGALGDWYYRTFLK